MSEKIFFHVDCNSAFISFASIESLQNGGEDYRKIPAVVSQKPGVRGAIVAAASQPAKELGIIVPEHINSALAKYKDLVIVEPDFSVYKKWSSIFKQLCKGYAKEFESYSIDECVFTVRDVFLKNKNPGDLGIEIRNLIKEKIDLDVTVGVAHTKTFAKICSDFKPSGVYWVDENNFKEYLWKLPIERLIMCGPKTTEKLHNNKIYTIEELAQKQMEEVQQIVGKKHGEYLWLQANGLDDSEVVTERQERKSLSREETLQISVKNIDDIKKEFIKILEETIEILEKEHLKTKRIGIKLRSDEFVDKNFYKTLDEYTNDFDIILKEIIDLIERNYNSESIRQVGIKFEKLSKE